ncbi:MAG: hypothetical protein ABIV25_09350 [Paracoccaceae bacterium]
MSVSNLFKDALGDLGDDIAYHAVKLVRWAFDVLCLLALGLLCFATNIDSANAGLHSRPIFGVHAHVAGSVGVAVTASHAPTSCHMTNDLLDAAHRSCTNAMILEPANI